MYAVAFDLDQESLRVAYPGNSPSNAYLEIRTILLEKGFSWTQGSLYFGGPTINAVTCVLAVSDLSRRLSWFTASVRDIRMLRIEENNDLRPALA